MPSSRLGPGHPLGLVSTWPPTVTPVSGAARVTHPGTPQPPPVPPRLPGQSWLLQQEGAPSLPPLERGGARWGGTTHEFRKPVWSHAGWKERRKEALEVPGFAAWWQRPQAAGTCPLRPGHPPAKATVLPPGTETAGELRAWPHCCQQDRPGLDWDHGQSDSEAGWAQDRGVHPVPPHPIVPSTHSAGPSHGRCLRHSGTQMSL